MRTTTSVHAIVAATAALLIACCSHARPAPPARTSVGTGPATTSPRAEVVVVGHSVRRRQIRAYVVGNPRAPLRLLLVGCIHGDERAGVAITHRLRSLSPPAGAVWWLIDAFNPDGCSAGTRQNADGVDLNRNSPWHWRPLDRPGGLFYSGKHPLSEPESGAINRLVTRTRPAITIWYHEHASLVDTSSGGDRAIEARYARAVGLPLRNYGVFPGSITAWQNASFQADTAFVVELPPGRLSRPEIARHVAAIITLSTQG